MHAWPRPSQEAQRQTHPSAIAYHIASPKAVRRANAAKSKIRSRVEHVFAEQKDRMKLFVRTIGIARAKVKIGMANLVYNFKRLIFLQRTAAA